MKIKELAQKNKKELSNLLIENRKKVSRLRFDLASKKIKNVRQVRELKRDIVRILTILNKQNDE